MAERAKDTAEFHERWRTPAEVEALLPREWDRLKRRIAIAKRLQDELLSAAAETITRPRMPPQTYQLLTGDAFGNFVSLTEYGAVDEFWERGELQKERVNSTGYGGGVLEYRAYGIRIGPDGVALLLQQNGLSPPSVVASAHQSAPAAVLAGAPPVEVDAVSPRPPISSATLTAWWEMCKTIKPAAHWDGPSMRAFFDQCFPDKAVSRERLRDIRGPQKSGPKAKSAE